MDTSPHQLCFRCGIDVSASKRFKDIAGKYYCEACAQAVKRRATLARISPAGVAAGEHAAPETQPVAVSRDAQGTGATREAAPNPASERQPPSASAGEYALSPVEEVITRAPCLKCGSSFQPGKAECVMCGFDPATVPLNPEKAREVLGDFDAHPDDTAENREERRRRKAEREEMERVRSVPTCKQCGYELSGLVADKRGGVQCPECGTSNRFYTRYEHDEMVSRQMEKEAVRKPLIYLCIGGGTYFAIVIGASIQAASTVSRASAIGGAVASGPNYAAAIGAVIGGAIIFGGASFIGVVMYLILGRFLLGGVDSHLRHTVFFVTSAMSCALALFAVGAVFLGSWVLLLPYGVAAFLYAALLADFTDTDLRDARIISIVTWVFIMGLLYTSAFF
ncbi:MAG: hypothetical protein WC718_01035 [Phycisphaerales bacterium]|jgi:hypothetical protein